MNNDSDMAKVKKNAWQALSLLGLVLCALSAVFIIKEVKSLPYVGKDVPAMNTISVSGEGEAFQKPDIATFSFTVEDENLIVGKAQEKVNSTMADILSYLKKSGVAEKDIKTTNYSVYPRYEYNQIQCFTYPCPTGRQTLAGYVVSQSVFIKVRKLEDAGKLVSGIGESGATNISGLTFSVDQQDAVEREAREKAITNAKEKAQQLARDLGVRLVRIVSYSEGGNYPIYYGKDMAMGMGGDMQSAPRAAELPTGENQFVSNVTITYEIR